MFNLQRVSTKVLLAMLGAAYLTTFSQLELNLVAKSVAVLLPIQLLALAYGIYLISEQKSGQGDRFHS